MAFLTKLFLIVRFLLRMHVNPISPLLRRKLHLIFSCFTSGNYYNIDYGKNAMIYLSFSFLICEKLYH